MFERSVPVSGKRSGPFHQFRLSSENNQRDFSENNKNSNSVNNTISNKSNNSANNKSSNIVNNNQEEQTKVISVNNQFTSLPPTNAYNKVKNADKELFDKEQSTPEIAVESTEADPTGFILVGAKEARTKNKRLPNKAYYLLWRTAFYYVFRITAFE